MKAGTSLRVVAIGLSVVALVSCAETGGFGQRSFQSQYNDARTALETGKYKAANKIYEHLLPQAGPLNNRIQLEFSHSHLRAGDFDKAARMAGALANSQDSTARSAALSVQGTAEHEAALQLLAQGNTELGVARLKIAQKAIEEVLSKDPALDPLGSLAGRRASIAVRLKSLP